MIADGFVSKFRCQKCLLACHLSYILTSYTDFLALKTALSILLLKILHLSCCMYAITEAWGANPLSTVPWDDEERPVATCKTFRVEYDIEEFQGVLTDRIITLGSSYLDRCPTTDNYVLCKCDLQKKVICSRHLVLH